MKINGFFEILSNEYNFNLLDGLACCLSAYASLAQSSGAARGFGIIGYGKACLEIEMYEIRVLTPRLVLACTCTAFAMIIVKYGLIYCHK